jgi:aspartate oxidase
VEWRPFAAAEDRFEDHIADTLTLAGAGIVQREVVEVVVREAWRAVESI